MSFVNGTGRNWEGAPRRWAGHAPLPLSTTLELIKTNFDASSSSSVPLELLSTPASFILAQHHKLQPFLCLSVSLFDSIRSATLPPNHHRPWPPFRCLYPPLRLGDSRDFTFPPLIQFSLDSSHHADHSRAVLCWPPGELSYLHQYRSVGLSLPVCMWSGTCLQVLTAQLPCLANPIEQPAALADAAQTEAAGAPKLAPYEGKSKICKHLGGLIPAKWSTHDLDAAVCHSVRRADRARKDWEIVVSACTYNLPAALNTAQ